MHSEYSERNAILRRLGFPDYKCYLLSPLWKIVRERAFLIHGEHCRGHRCHHHAAEIHHGNYSYETLIGEDVRALYPVCRSCHKKASLDRKGKVRSLKGTNAVLFGVGAKPKQEKQPKKKKQADLPVKAQQKSDKPARYNTLRSWIDYKTIAETDEKLKRFGFNSYAEYMADKRAFKKRQAALQEQLAIGWYLKHPEDRKRSRKQKRKEQSRVCGELILPPKEGKRTAKDKREARRQLKIGALSKDMAPRLRG